MHLREVTLRNWRSYRTATFKFPKPKGARRVLLVGAMNGTGKTSLLTALYLGLFGREAMYFLEGVKVAESESERLRSYKQVIQRILHRPALETEDPHASVQLVFEHDDGQATITRTWHYTRGGQTRDLDSHEGEEIRIDDNGTVRRPRDWQEANNRIADLIFPAHVMPCFFFDGEQAQERVESSGAAALSEAIKVLFGTRLVEELDESLRTYVANQRTVAKRDVGDIDVEKLERARRRRDELQDELDRLKKQLDAVKGELQTNEDARKEKLHELSTMTGDVAVDLQLLSQRKIDLQQEEMALRQKLMDRIASLSLPMALRKLGTRVADKLQGEIIRDRWQVLRDETEAKVDQIIDHALPRPNDRSLEPPLTKIQYGQLTERLRKGLESLWSPPPTGCAPEFKYEFLGMSDRTTALARVKALLARAGVGVSSLVDEWQSSRNQLKEAERKWDAIRDIQPKLEAIKTRVSELTTRIDELNHRRAGLEGNERGLQSELRDTLAAIGQMEQQKLRLGPVEQKLDLAERVRSVVADLRERLVPLCKTSLEDRCTLHFREMIAEQYRRHRIEFDGELQPRLVGATQVPIYISTLSGAEKRAFGLAFTLAVADISGEASPIVIDTPVGNMDSEYRQRILTYLARVAPGQIIFLSHDEEIYGEYVNRLEPYLLQKYLVEFQRISEGAGVSTVTEGRYLTAHGA